MKNNIKFIYFDIGNVFHTKENVFKTVANDFGLKQEVFINDFDKKPDDLTMGKMMMSDFWKICCKKINIKNGFGYDFIKSCMLSCRAILPVHKLAINVAKNYKTGILSNYYQDFFEEAMRQGLIPKIKFDEVIISAEVGMMKPNRDIYDLAQEWSGFESGEIFFIDDKKENLLTAAKMGWQTFLFDYNNPQKSCEEIEILLKLDK